MYVHPAIIFDMQEPNKTLKFKAHLADQIQGGTKVSTWRLFDDKDLKENDMVDLYVNGVDTPFAHARITKVLTKKLGSLSDEDWIGHERFESDEQMYETYRSYYGPSVDANTEVKLIWFSLM